MPDFSVISDIHAHRSALDATLTDIGTDRGIWFLGDLFDRGNEPAWVYNTLSHYEGPENILLAGNHDLAIAYQADPHKYSCWRYQYEQLKDEYKASCEGQVRKMPLDYIENVASRRVSAGLEVDKIGVYLVHGFPAHDANVSLIQYYHESAPQNGHRVDYQQLREKVTPTARIWLVGHSHRQGAWLYGGKDAGWSEWLPDFGVGVDGRQRMVEPKTDRAETVAEASLDFNRLPEDAFLVLSPGSVAFSNDTPSGTRAKRAKYIRLEISNLTVRAQFRAVPYYG